MDHYRYYQRDADHKLTNVPAVDNSLKWAGGGFLSTVGDLLQFGNAMLYSYQFSSKGNFPIHHFTASYFFLPFD